MRLPRTGLRDAAWDLLLGGHCVGCATPGRLLCEPCAALLPRGARPTWPTPVPSGLVEPWAAAAYEGTVRALVLGLKERGLLDLAVPLSRLLASAVATDLASCDDLVLVPVPSRRSTVRGRGHDPTATITARAARLLGVRSARLLRLRAGVVDQAGLDAGARAANLAGSMHCPTHAVRRLALATPYARLVVCDDVLTTGSTAREAQRALEAVGLTVLRVAAVAATPRRHPVRPEVTGISQAVRLSWPPVTD